MKTYLLILSLFLVANCGVYAQNNGSLVPNNTAKAVAKAVWEKTSHDFGTIKQGVPVSVTFKFANKGGAPLIISDVKRTCGCTTPFYTSDPILPGRTGVIKTQYNAASLGAFDKTVTVFTNSQTQPEIKLRIKGTVVE